ncbi:uncharacterized protein LOC143263903 isoform X7 [Megachile rotundata]|uniref:uncharacterized protein LOC143263903 isoform X7 n=1 Tax=Megachile rotundata TaxID=143995 RepID=UPI003FCFF15D
MLGQREHRTFLSTLFYVVNVLYRCSRFPCLTIDNRLAIVTNDCYRRISIGSKLADTDVTFQSTASSLTECEEQCSKLGNVCEAFSFGVGVKGNGSCSITDRTPPFENLSTHPDYDVYVKKQWISPQCDSDYLYGSFRSETGARLTKTDETSNEQNVANTNGTSSTFIPWPFFLSVPPINAKSLSRSREDTANYKLLGIYDQSINHHGRFLSGDDSRNRILDSLANRNERTASSSLFVRICHRKIQAGKKMVKLLAERVINCEKLQDCCRACAYEKSFVCRGFNHRHGTDDSRCTCELTSASYSRMDADDDFLVDTDYDYYEREQNCLPSTQFDDGSRWKNDPSEHYERTKPETWLNAKNANEDRYHVSSSAIDHHTPNRELDYGPARFQQFHYEDSLGFIPQENTRNRNVNWKQRFQNHYPDFVDHDTFPEYPVNYDKVSYSDARSPSSIKPRLENRLLFGQNRFSVSNTDEYPDGRHLNYGNAFGYNDNYVSAKKQSVHEERDQLSTTRKCSIKTITGSKLSRNVLRKTCLTHDFEQCEQLCTNETDFPCESFAYRINADNAGDNCLFSDISMQDLRPNLDYVYDNGHLLYSWKDFDPYCSVPTNHFHAINVTPAAAFEKHDRPYWFTTSNRSRPQVHPFNADIPIAIRDPTTRAETTKFQFESYRHNFDHDSNNIENGSLYGSTGFERDFTFHRSKELSTFQRYTVNGYPCKNATVCQRNEITGFWSCEIEQGEHGSWDYCCEPDHRCGFSRGYHYPWCYVGMNEDQWRPCSETYYPYFLSKNRSLYRQSPKYIARHWPVIYFHEMQPPNCSMDNSNNRISYLNQRFTKIRRNRLH